MEKVVWKAKDGRDVTVTVYVDFKEVGVKAYVGETFLGRGLVVYDEAQANGAAASIGKLGMVKANLDRVQAAIRVVEGNSPEIQMAKLRKERKSLVSRLALIQDIKYESDRAAINATMSGRPVPLGRDFDAEIDAAEKAVKDFDAAHPEVIEAIGKEEKEGVDKWI